MVRQLFFSLAVLMTGLAADAQPAFPSPSGSSSVSPISPISASMSPEQSPVALFRKLLAMSPGERNNALTNRSSVMRARILSKVHEYLLLPPEERELRLRSTELRWYLTPLLSMSPADRQIRLSQMPEDMRLLVQERLSQWDILPPSLKEEFLTNDSTMHYFAHVNTAGNSVTNTAQAALAAQFNQFFDLTPAETRRALNTLSDNERAEMEKTLKSFDQLPPEQRQLCIRNYARFAGMSDAERAEFLKNADRWSRMTPQERQTWRDLVNHVPIWPPMPMASVDPSAMAVIPPSSNGGQRPPVATN